MYHPYQHLILLHIMYYDNTGYVRIMYAKQKHLGCKKVRGQSEAALQIGMCDQKL